MVPIQPDKWEPLIEQMNHAEELPEKFDILATMVKMLAINDMACMESRIDELSRKFDSCMKKIYVVGFIIAALEFTGVNIKTVIDLMLRIAK
jgi:methyl coenzyme M reductase beta subunit